jgi:putative hemolysin
MDNFEITKFVDVEQVIRNKSEKLHRMVPGFVIHWLRRVVHEDEVNYVLSKYRHLEGLPFIEATLNELGLKVVAEGNLDWNPQGRYIFVANHPLGGMDGLALMMVVGRKMPDIVFPVNDILLSIPNTRSLFVPINKHGRNPHLVKQLDETFAGDRTLLYFPAGLCSRRQGGRIVDLEWKKTFVTKARIHHRDIIPVYAEGSNSKFFYRLANIRKALGIKFNIEMLFLVDEMVKQKGKTLTLRFGKPIPYTLLDNRYTDSQWAARIKEHVYKLAHNPNTPFEP